jgi:hypothetical protein
MAHNSARVDDVAKNSWPEFGQLKQQYSGYIYNLKIINNQSNNLFIYLPTLLNLPFDLPTHLTYLN